MRLMRLMAATVVGLALPTLATGSTDDAVARMLATLKAAYPATEFRDVRATPLPGIFEVTMGRNVAYVSSDGRWFLFGHLYDMHNQRDITAERLEQASRIDFAALPLEDAITVRRGDGSRVLVVFSDPDCPYCKRLEKELAKLDNVTVHTFLFPIEALHPQARAKAVSVWCAPDRAAAWKALMLDGIAPRNADCDHPVDRNVALARSLGVDGTPTLFDVRGRRLTGAAPLKGIEDFLAGAGR